MSEAESLTGSSGGSEGGRGGGGVGVWVVAVGASFRLSFGTSVFKEGCKEMINCPGLPGTVLGKPEQLVPWMCQEPLGPEL